VLDKCYLLSAILCLLFFVFLKSYEVEISVK